MVPTYLRYLPLGDKFELTHNFSFLTAILFLSCRQLQGAFWARPLRAIQPRRGALCLRLRGWNPEIVAGERRQAPYILYVGTVGRYRYQLYLVVIQHFMLC